MTNSMLDSTCRHRSRSGFRRTIASKLPRKAAYEADAPAREREQQAQKQRDDAYAAKLRTKYGADLAIVPTFDVDTYCLHGEKQMPTHPYMIRQYNDCIATERADYERVKSLWPIFSVADREHCDDLLSLFGASSLSYNILAVCVNQLEPKYETPQHFQPQ